MKRGELYRFLTLMFKTKLTHFVASLTPAKIAELDRALAHALDLPLGVATPLRSI